MNDEKLELIRKQDKVFPHNDEVNHEEITLHNRYGITLTADLYRSEGARGPLAAITVPGPFGAVKEQPNGLYAQITAERGFLALASDPSYTGESGSAPRCMISLDIGAEDFSAAVDHLSCREDVDPERIGIIGICGWGGTAINTAAFGPRIRVTVASTMYDMNRIAVKGYFDEQNSVATRDSAHARFTAQRTTDYRSGSYARAGGVVDPLPEDTPAFVRDYHDYYEVPRGYHLRSLNSSGGWDVVSTASFLNQPLLAYAGEVRTPVLIIHDEKAHSRYMGEGTFAQLTGESRELLVVPGASHTDLYDDSGRDAIPFDRITEFFRASLTRTRGLTITPRPPSWDRVPAPPQPGCGPG